MDTILTEFCLPHNLLLMSNMRHICIYFPYNVYDLGKFIIEHTSYWMPLPLYPSVVLKCHMVLSHMPLACVHVGPPNIIQVVKSKTNWVGHVACTEKGEVQSFVGRSEGKRLLASLGADGKIILKLILKK